MALFDDLRSAWGARPPKAAPTYVAPSRRTEFMNHWNGGPTGLTAASDHSRCLAVVKADQVFHMDGRGWNDIGYNGLICPHARAIECRGIDYAGAHCPDHNTSAYGWQFAIGKGETATPAMFARMARALADCEDRSHHDLRLMGHRDGFNTECPGDQIEAWVKAGMPGAQVTKEWFEMALDAQAKQDITDACIAALKTDGLVTSPKASNPTVAPVTGISDAGVWALQARDRVTGLAAQVAALSAAVETLASSKGVDPAAVKAAVTEALDAYSLTLSKESS